MDNNNQTNRSIAQKVAKIIGAYLIMLIIVIVIFSIAYLALFADADEAGKGMGFAVLLMTIGIPCFAMGLIITTAIVIINHKK